MAWFFGGLQWVSSKSELPLLAASSFLSGECDKQEYTMRNQEAERSTAFGRRNVRSAVPYPGSVPRSGDPGEHTTIGPRVVLRLRARLLELRRKPLIVQAKILSAGGGAEESDDP